MKFLSALVFASSVAAQASVVLDAVSSISDATTALQSAVEGFTGAEQAADLTAASEAVLSAINDGNAAVEPIEPLSDTDALSLAGPVQDLADLTSAAVDSTIAQRDAFDAASVSSVVLSQLTALRDAAETFSATVLTKIPEDLQPIAGQISQQITDALNRGVEAYADAEDDGGDDSSSSSSSASSTASESSSSGSATATSSGSASTTATATGTGAPIYTTPAPSGGSTGAPVPTAPSPPISTGAAVVNVANFGAAAAAALLVAAF